MRFQENASSTMPTPMERKTHLNHIVHDQHKIYKAITKSSLEAIYHYLFLITIPISRTQKNPLTPHFLISHKIKKKAQYLGIIQK